MLVDNGEGYILIDTGSPASFHSNGHIIIDGIETAVPTSAMGVTPAYLSEKIGAPVKGLLGTDILGRTPTLIDLPSKRLVFNYDKEGTKVPSFNIMSCYGVELSVDGNLVKMLLDTGAPTSYASKSLTAGKEVLRTVEDFSPFCANDKFTTPIYSLETSFGGKTFSAEFGNLPGFFGAILPSYGVDGIIGTVFFERFPVILDKGRVSIFVER